MTLTDADLWAAAVRCYLAETAGLLPAAEDLGPAGIFLARVDDGCRCDLVSLRTSIRRPSAADADQRPIVQVDGHAPGCPCHPGPGRPPGLRLAA